MQRTKNLQASCAALGLLASLQFAPAALADTQHEGKVTLGVAKVRSDADHSMILGAARAGTRIVAVGERGVVLLSDDDGQHFRQAHHVPANAALTSVTFVDAQHGWAVGHWGVVMRTDDGGENWRLQRSDTSVDQPLFSVAFRDARHGWAVGLWSLLLATDDGGESWKPRSVNEGAGADSGKSGLNFYSVFVGQQQDVYIAGEQGTVFRSSDDGASWRAQHTGYKGTLWAGAVGPDHAIYVGGLRGNLFESDDGGSNWRSVSSGASESITDLVADERGVAGVALDGSVTLKKAGQSGFVATQVPGRDALTAIVLKSDGSPVLFSKQGVLAK